MSVAPGPSRRVVLLIITFSTLIGIIFVYAFRSQPFRNEYQPYTREEYAAEDIARNGGIPSEGRVAIASPLGNETAKIELGRAAWKLFHTVMARFPDKPTVDESQALRDYIYLFQRLYPCGECSEHFHEILLKFPPQTSSRSTAAAWACHVHNQVNLSLGKEMFDCSKIGDFYDCGCAEDEEKTILDRSIY